MPHSVPHFVLHSVPPFVPHFLRHYLHHSDLDCVPHSLLDFVPHCGLDLVDLARSESLKVPGAQGIQQKEGIAINKAFTHLLTMLTHLCAKERADYRSQPIGWLKKDSLGGNAKAAMIANFSPGVHSQNETLKTLERVNLRFPTHKTHLCVLGPEPLLAIDGGKGTLGRS